MMMMNHKAFRLVGISLIFLVMLLACNSLTGLGEDYQEVRSTAESIATQAQAMITQAQGIATEIVESDALATARAFATQEGPPLVATGEALATQAAGAGYLETVESFVTNEPGGLLETAQALATNALGMGGQPEDVPLLAEETRSQFFANASIISYATSVDLPTSINFYKTSMPFNGWEPISEGNLETESAAILRYAKDDRIATVTLTASPLTRQTVVLITITPR
jgi:hypothetical protein